MDPSSQSEGLMALACASPLWAAGLGGLLGTAATALGAAVAQRTHAAGLRRIPPPPASVWLFQGLLPGLLSGALVALLADRWLLALALGLVWGYSAGELANHARSAWAWAAVMSDGEGLERWQALSPGLRGRLVVGQVAGPLFLVLIAALISLQPGVMGLALGAALQLATVARAARALERSASAPPPAESEPR